MTSDLTRPSKHQLTMIVHEGETVQHLMTHASHCWLRKWLRPPHIQTVRIYLSVSIYPLGRGPAYSGPIRWGLYSRPIAL